MPTHDQETPQEGHERIDIGPATSGPRMRAWGTHDIVRRIEEFQPGAGRLLRSKVSPIAYESLQRTGRFDWISLRHAREFPAAVLAVLGEDEFQRFFRWMLPSQANRPMLRGILRTSIALFGLTPHTFVRTTVSVWKLAFTDFANPRIEEAGPRSTTLVLEQVADEAFEEDAYLRSFVGSFMAFYDICKVDGRIDLQIDRAASVVRFHFAW